MRSKAFQVAFFVAMLGCGDRAGLAIPGEAPASNDAGPIVTVVPTVPASSSSGGGSEDAEACPGESLCGSECVDLESDPNDCVTAAHVVLREPCTMVLSTFSPIRVASCPARTSRAEAIVPAFWLGACLCTSVGCVPTPTSWTIAYGGTASLDGAKGATQDLAHQSIAVMSCAPSLRSRAWYEAPEPFAILTVGDRCTIDGAWATGTFLAKTGGQCVLSFRDREVALRVTDAMARRPVVGGRYGPYEDSTYIEVQIAGDTMHAQGPGEHVRYRFSGTIGNAVDASQPCLDALQRRKLSGSPSS